MVKTALSSAMGVGKWRKASELRRKLLGGPSALLVDPLGFDAGDSNLYRYVSNSPTDVTDSTGTNEEFPAPETPPLPAVLTKDHLITTKELEAKVQVLGKRGSLTLQR